MIDEPGYLQENRDLVNLNISDSLRAEIARIDAEYETMPRKECYEAFKGVLRRYFEENPPSGKKPSELPLLAMLFWEVTKRTKVAKTAKKRGQLVSYWGLNNFNYVFILGRPENEVSDISWTLVDDYKIAASAVVEVYKIVKEIAKETNQPVLDVYTTVLQLQKEFDSTGRTGLNQIWSESVQNRIRKHFGLGPLPPKGTRKHKNVLPPMKKVVEPQMTEETSSPSAIPEMASVKDRPHTEPSPEPIVKVVRALDTKEAAKNVKAAFIELIDLRTAEIPIGERSRVRSMSLSFLSDAIEFLNSTCRRLAREERDQRALSAATKALNARRDYEHACSYFGVKVTGHHLADEAPIKKIFRQMSKDLHPDLNPGREKEVLPRFQELQEKYEIIVSYNHTQKENGSL